MLLDYVGDVMFRLVDVRHADQRIQSEYFALRFGPNSAQAVTRAQVTARTDVPPPEASTSSLCKAQVPAHCACMYVLSGSAPVTDARIHAWHRRSEGRCHLRSRENFRRPAEKGVGTSGNQIPGHAWFRRCNSDAYSIHTMAACLGACAQSPGVSRLRWEYIVVSSIRLELEL